MSFFELANSTFGLNFESWYENGFWGSHYVPFSYKEDNRIVANVSVNILDFIIEGKQHHALQIGTVMTHPDYQGRGLSKSLMNKVFEEFKGSYDFMYLFANDRVLDFYPKFGFKKVQEHQYWTDFMRTGRPNSQLRKLDINNKDDLNFIYSFAKERIPVSNRFATSNAPGIFMYHCLNVFPNEIYFQESEQAILIFNHNDNEINIIDIISKQPVNIHHVLNDIANGEHDRIIFHYTPDYQGINLYTYPAKDGGTLFVKTNGDHCFPAQVKHPITSEA
ncbi:GNAT family N-acetyltransferase [Bacillus rubiinfantis]|uniref:GNAT family N-acetyltransferase n=1 Tax=Bacillus rubiinfantis TaxID=1499680 RepID=UPI001FE9251E|nr:GNAT family N-acetyltransferase [Bacillus rubiinfantis]